MRTYSQPFILLCEGVFDVEVDMVATAFVVAYAVIPGR